MKALLPERGFLGGARIGRPKAGCARDTLMPLKTNTEAYQSVMA